MKTTIPLFYVVLAFLSVTLSPQARAVCQEGCDTVNNNTFLGDDALSNEFTGVNNTAIGYFALHSDEFFGDNNTAVGFSVLTSNTTGFYNTAAGVDALIFNTTGHDNTAIGVSALYNNTTGISNTAVGVNALVANTGNENIAVGANAGFNLLSGGNNIYIGNQGRGSESRTIRVGEKQTHRATFIAGISGATVANGVGVIIDTNGQLGTIVSSERFKEAIQPMDKTSESILALQPVTFRYKHDLDPEGIPQFGLVAEEVEKVNPDLVARDSEGKPYTVRYEAVNAMLLNEFLKEHKKVEEQQGTVAQLKSTVAQQQEGFEAKLAQQQKQIDALAAGLQKVNAQLELSKSAPQTVLNDQ